MSSSSRRRGDLDEEEIGPPAPMDSLSYRRQLGDSDDDDASAPPAPKRMDSVGSVGDDDVKKSSVRFSDAASMPVAVAIPGSRVVYESSSQPPVLDHMASSGMPTGGSPIVESASGDSDKERLIESIVKEQAITPPRTNVKKRSIRGDGGVSSNRDGSKKDLEAQAAYESQLEDILRERMSAPPAEEKENQLAIAIRERLSKIPSRSNVKRSYDNNADKHTDDQNLVITKIDDDRRRKKKMYLFGGLAVIVLALAIGLGVGLSGSSSSDSTTPVPVEMPLEPGSLEWYRDQLYPVSGEKLDDPESNQNKALRWVAMADDLMSTKEIEMRYVAAVLYFSLNGERWDNQYNFLSEDDVCKWHNEESGIFCVNGAFSELFLRTSIMSKYFSSFSSLRENANVQSFFLILTAFNNVTGTIPEEIGAMSTLKMIDMSDNTISGTLPSSFGNLIKLEQLDLKVNALTGTIPDPLYTLNRVKEIILDGNEFTGTINPSLGTSPTLELFWVFGSGMNGTLPGAIGQSTTLTSIDFSGNSLTGTIPEFASSSRMEFLYLGFNDLVGTIPDSIGSLPALKELSLSRNQLTGSIPDFSDNFGALTFIDLSRNALIGSVERLFDTVLPESLGQIALWSNLLTGTLPSTIERYSLLTELFLNDNNISGTVPISVADLSDLGKCRRVGCDIQGCPWSLTTFLVPSVAFALSETLVISMNEFESLEGFCNETISIGKFAANTCSETTIECACCNFCCDSAFDCSEL